MSRRTLVLMSLLVAGTSVSACGDDESAGFAMESTRDSSGGGGGGSADTSSSPRPDASMPSVGDTSMPWGGDTSSSPNDASGTADTAGPSDVTGNTNISFGGAQDFGYVRSIIESGRVPRPADLDPAGFFAEHSTPLPDPVCGRRICVQAMLGVMGNLINGNNCTMLQLGMNSPIVVDPSDRPPLTLAVTIDVSGSMEAGDKIGYVRQGLERLVSSLNDDDQLALVTYENVARTVWQMQPIRSNRNTILQIVRGLQANGGTNLHDGLKMAYDAVSSAYDSGRQNRVILLSDGQPTTGVTSTAAIIAMSAARNSDGIGLTTVGLGSDFNLELMRGLAEQADGNFYFLENSTAVDEVFTEELAYFTLPVAFDVTIDVRSGNLYSLVRANGSSRFVLDDGGGTFSVPSVFFAHRQAPDDVFEGEDGVGRRGGGSMLVLELMPEVWDGEVPPEAADVAEVTLTFREPGTNAILEEKVIVNYPYSPDYLVPTGFFENAIVTKSFVVLNIYFAIEEAALRFHGGQAVAARDVLARVIAAAEDYEDSANDGQGDLDIRFDIELMQDLIGVIERLSNINQPAPQPPADPWPLD